VTLTSELDLDRVMMNNRAKYLGYFVPNLSTKHTLSECSAWTTKTVGKKTKQKFFGLITCLCVYSISNVTVNIAEDKSEAQATDFSTCWKLEQISPASLHAGLYDRSVRGFLIWGACAPSGGRSMFLGVPLQGQHWPTT